MQRIFAFGRVIDNDFRNLSLRVYLSRFHRQFFLSLHSPSAVSLFSRFSAPFRALYRTRRTKETMTPQLAKLLIYRLFNQINERVEAHFYAPSPVIYGLW